MKERTSRIRAIQNLVSTQKIESQESLLIKLEELGFSVTQATLSRDLKHLRVGKVSDGMNGYYYSLPKEGNETHTRKGFIQDVERGLLNINFSGNIAVIKTRQGHAESVGFALDQLSLPEVLGTLAGEDTVFAVIKEDVSREALLESFRNSFPNLGL